MRRRGSRFNRTEGLSFIESFRASHPLGKLFLARWLLAVHWNRDHFRSPEDHVDALRELGIAVPDDEDELENNIEQTDYGMALQRCEESLASLPPLLEPMAGNLLKLGKAAELPERELTVFQALLAIYWNRSLRGILNGNEMTFSQSVSVLAWFVQMPEHEVLDVLRPDGPLEASGLLFMDRTENWWHEHLSIAPAVVAHIDAENFTPDLLLGRLVRDVPVPEMSREDFSHLGDDVLLLEQCLSIALDTGQTGVNILLYGPPGTGKTQLAHWLVAHVGAKGMEIRARNFANQQRFGHNMDDRFGIYRIVQALAARDARQIVLFDEVEDVFTSWGRSRINKASVNHNLLNNRVPTIWITNDVSNMDDAYIRRFDMVVPVLTPKLAVRERILKEAVAPVVLPKKMVKAIAAHPDLTPGVMTRAADLVKATMANDDKKSGKPGSKKNSSKKNSSKKINSERFLRLVNNTLVCQGHKAVQLEKSADEAEYRVETPYSVKHVNTSIPLQEIADMLCESGEGRVCLFGPPGTGKSAFVHELGKRMKRKVLVCNPSDIQDKYIGETEKNMAKKFAEAQKQKAILFFDEFDSFLSSREMHSRSWELSQVNEMLTQIERFNGILFAATNQRAMIDKAAIRRFDFKVDFDWMMPEQAFALFGQVLSAHGWKETPLESWQNELGRLHMLAPGDFAVAARQARLMGKKSVMTPEKLYAILQSEVQNKRLDSDSKPMGFLASI